MPCSDGNSRYCDGSCNSHYKTRADMMARMLCALCKSLVSSGRRAYINQTPGLAQWWEQHQKEDAAREAYEAKAKREQRLRDEKEFERLKKKLGKTS